MAKRSIAVERLIDLHEALARFAPHSRQRRREILKVAKESGVSEWTVRRQYAQWINLHLKGRVDKGKPRVTSAQELEEWVEMLEDGITYEGKVFQLPRGKLTSSTANR